MHSLGKLASEATLGIVGAFQRDNMTAQDLFADWKAKLAAADLGNEYKYTGQIMDVALHCCLGGSDKDPRHGHTPDTSIPWRLKDGTTNRHWAVLFLKQRLESLVSGAWRVFASPVMNWMGLAPAGARYDDILAILCDAGIPFVLRPLPEQGQDAYTFIGPAYIHGVQVGPILRGLYSRNDIQQFERIRIL